MKTLSKVLNFHDIGRQKEAELKMFGFKKRRFMGLLVPIKMVHDYCVLVDVSCLATLVCHNRA